MSPARTKTIQELEERIDERFAPSVDNTLINLLYEKPLEFFIYVIALVFVVYHLWYAFAMNISLAEHGFIHLGFILFLWGVLQANKLDRSTTEGKVKASAYLVYSTGALIPIYYVYSNYIALIRDRAGFYNEMDLFVGGLLLVLMLIPLWQVSRIIAGVYIFGLLYSYFGEWMPGALHHSGLSLERTITMNTVEVQGLLGNLLQISATVIVIFIMLAAFVEKYGGMATLVKALTRKTATSKYLGVGHVAVLASMGFGSLNGAVTANVASTGSFTIPLMKENRYPPKLAGAIESVASCGGQVMPPVMGSAAFVMADFIDLSYADIIVAAAIPAVLFYVTVAIAVTLYSRDIEGMHLTLEVSDRKNNAEKGLSFVRGFLSNVEYIATLVVLIYWLLILRSDPLTSAFYSIVVLLALSFVNHLFTGYRAGKLKTMLKEYGRFTLEGARRGCELIVPITIMVASLGVVVRAFVVTGLAQNLSYLMINFAGENPALLVLLAAVVSMVFGLGMPTLAAYLLVSLFVAPSLTPVLDVPEIAIHLFILYFAIVSNITPPIAIGVVIAVGIAESDFIETCIEAIRVGFPMFLLPFVFLYRTELLFPATSSVWPLLIVSIAFIIISIAIVGFDDLPVFPRIALAFVGIVVIFAQGYVQLLFVLIAMAALALVVPTIRNRIPVGISGEAR